MSIIVNMAAAPKDGDDLPLGVDDIVRDELKRKTEACRSPSNARASMLYTSSRF